MIAYLKNKFQMDIWRRNKTFFLLILIYFAGLIAYFNSFSGEFVFDDINTIVNSRAVKSNLSLSSLWEINHSRFIPLLTFVFNYRLNQLNPENYHFINFLIHIVNSFLVFFLFNTILKISPPGPDTSKKSSLLPFITAVIFTVHPLQTSAVSYISQRATLIVSFFYLMTLLFYLLSKSGKLKISIIFYFLSLAITIPALISKENGYSLPLIILVTDYFFFFRQNLKNKIRFLKPLPFFILAGTVFYFIYLQRVGAPFEVTTGLSMTGGDRIITRQEYLFTQIKVVPFYIYLLLLPLNLNVDYDFPISKTFFSPDVIIPFIFSLAIFVISAPILYKKRRPAIWGLIFFFITLSVESSIIPIKDVIFEHRLYLPSAGFISAVVFIASAVVIQMIKKNKKTGNLINLTVISIITLYIVLTVNRNKVWQSEYSLWSDTVKKSPKKARVRYNLGVASYAIGKTEEAKAEFGQAINLDPHYSDAYRNLGFIFERENNFNKAYSLYNDALSINFYNTKSRAQLAAFYINQKKYNEGILQYLKILEYDPKNAAVYNDLGIIYLIQNRQEETINSFKKAIKLDPKNEIALKNLVNSLWHFGFDDEARKYYLKLIKLNPENSQAYQFMFNP